MNKPFILLIEFYQYLISPLLGSNCRFYPTCSCYARESFRVFPFYKALWYSSVRIIKCNPFHQGGYDPCPKPEINNE